VADTVSIRRPRRAGGFRCIRARNSGRMHRFGARPQRPARPARALFDLGATLHRPAGRPLTGHGWRSGLQSDRHCCCPASDLRPTPEPMSQPQAVIDRIIALAATGLSRSAVAEQVGLSRSLVIGVLWRRGIAPKSELLSAPRRAQCRHRWAESVCCQMPTSAIERITDSSQTSRHVRKVPKGDIALFDHLVGERQ
jgi:hypothetical protein